MEELTVLEARLAYLEKQIRENRKRLPAHSVKPPVMMDLLALEDEYHEIFSRIRTIKAACGPLGADHDD